MSVVLTVHSLSLLIVLLYTALLLGTLRMPYKEVRNMVLSVDDKLSEAILAQLLKYMPKREEVRNSTHNTHALDDHIVLSVQMESLAPYRNKILELSEAEQFGVVVSLT